MFPFFHLTSVFFNFFIDVSLFKCLRCDCFLPTLCPLSIYESRHMLLKNEKKTYRGYLLSFFFDKF